MLQLLASEKYKKLYRDLPHEIKKKKSGLSESTKNIGSLSDLKKMKR